MNSQNSEDQNQRHEKEYLSELFNFACILKGDVKYLEKIKEHIITEYVNTGLIKLIRPTYDKKELYLLTHEEWDEYQTLKKKNSRLIGAGFP